MTEHTKWSLPEKFTGVLEDMASRKIRHGCGPWEYADGTPMQDDARQFLDSLAKMQTENERHSEELAAYELTVNNLRAELEADRAQRVPDGWALVHTVTLRRWKDQVNEVAALSLKKERWATGAALKREIAEMIAAAPQPVAQPSTYGSVELQAMILARCIAKDVAQTKPAAPRKASADFDLPTPNDNIETKD